MKPLSTTLYYSGQISGESLPERSLAADRPAVMLTFLDIYNGDRNALDRFARHAKRRAREHPS
jgi:hypothetical protein